MVKKAVDTPPGLLLASDLQSGALQMEALQETYQKLKSSMLTAGTEGRIPVRQMVDYLDMLSNIRRIAEQVEKGVRYLASLMAFNEGGEPEPVEAESSESSDRAP